MTECYFCGEDIVIVTSLHNEQTQLVAPICVRCFNRASVCRDPLFFEGMELIIERPRLIYGRDWVFKE